MTLSNDKIATSNRSSPENPSAIDQSAEALAAPTANAEMDLNTLNKIRDLLFGQQVQKHEQRLDQLEHRLDQECANLREHMNQRLQVLETTLQTELKALSIKVQMNHEAQASVMGDLQNRSQTEMSAVNAQIERLGNDLNQKHDELRILLEHEVQNINAADDTDRAQLADLFSELAANIRENR